MSPQHLGGVFIDKYRTPQCSTLDKKWSKQFDIWPHRRSARIVQSYSPCGDNVHPHLIHGSLGPPESASQTHLDRFCDLERFQAYKAAPGVDFVNTSKTPIEVALVITYLQFPIEVCFLCIAGQPVTDTASVTVIDTFLNLSRVFVVVVTFASVKFYCGIEP